jgi:hypothetical protein
MSCLKCILKVHPSIKIVLVLHMQFSISFILLKNFHFKQNKRNHRIVLVELRFGNQNLLSE